ncbi:MAG: hypothetical protein PHU42_03140 [Patescibacteria group bacterium]|nr:hypothetical protein [Patescibacteria group bacterium]
MRKKIDSLFSGISSKTRLAVILLLVVVIVAVGIWGSLRSRALHVLEVPGVFNLSDDAAKSNNKLADDNMVDVFAYNSAGETWRTNPNAVSGFPEKAELVATYGGLSIIDATTNAPWKIIKSTSANSAIPATITSSGLAVGSFGGVTAVNGKIYVGTFYNGLVIIDLANGKIYKASPDGGNANASTTMEYNGTVSQWGNDLGWKAPSIDPATYAIPGTSTGIIRDITSVVKNGKAYIAFSTSEGKISIIEDGVKTFRRTISYTGSLCADGGQPVQYLLGKVAFGLNGTLYIGNLYNSGVSMVCTSGSSTRGKPFVIAYYDAFNNIPSFDLRNITAANGTKYANPILNTDPFEDNTGTMAGVLIHPNTDMLNDISLSGGENNGNNTVFVATTSGVDIFLDSNGLDVPAGLYPTADTPAHLTSNKHWGATGAIEERLAENNALSVANNDADKIWVGQATKGLLEVSAPGVPTSRADYLTTTDIGIAGNAVSSLAFGAHLESSAIPNDDYLVVGSATGATRLAHYVLTPDSELTSSIQLSDSGKLVSNNVRDVFYYDTTKDSNSGWTTGSGKSWSTATPVRQLSAPDSFNEGGQLSTPCGGSVTNPSVIKVNNDPEGYAYRMFYVRPFCGPWYGKPTINQAKSRDGESWVDLPIVPTGGSYQYISIDPTIPANSAINNSYVDAPVVIQDPEGSGKFMMWFRGDIDKIYYSETTDIVNNSWSAPIEVLNAGNLAALGTVTQINDPWVEFDDINNPSNPYRMYFSYYNGVNWQIGKIDGFDPTSIGGWTNSLAAPFLSPGSSWDTGNVMSPTIGTLGTQKYLFYAGIKAGETVSHIGSVEICNLDSGCGGVTKGQIIPGPNNAAIISLLTSSTPAGMTGPAALVDATGSSMANLKLWYQGNTGKIYAGGSDYANLIGSATAYNISSVGGTFPQQANLVLTPMSLEIIDAKTNNLYMRFASGLKNAFHLDAYVRPTSVYALNGVIYIGLSSSNGNMNNSGLIALDLINDNATFYQAWQKGVFQKNGTAKTIMQIMADNPSDLDGYAFSGYLLANAADSLLFHRETPAAAYLTRDNTNNVLDINGAIVNGAPYVAISSSSWISNPDGSGTTGFAGVSMIKYGSNGLQGYDARYLQESNLTCNTAFGSCWRNAKKVALDDAGNLVLGEQGLMSTDNTVYEDFPFYINYGQDPAWIKVINNAANAGAGSWTDITNAPSLAIGKDDPSNQSLWAKLKDMAVVKTGSGHSIYAATDRGVFEVKEASNALSQTNRWSQSSYSNAKQILPTDSFNAVAFDGSRVFAGSATTGIAAFAPSAATAGDVHSFNTMSMPTPLLSNNVRALGFGTAGNDKFVAVGTDAGETILSTRVIEGDSDGDGIADKYDYCPLDATNSCSTTRKQAIICNPNSPSQLEIPGRTKLSYDCGNSALSGAAVEAVVGNSNYYLQGDIYVVSSYTFSSSSTPIGNVSVTMHWNDVNNDNVVDGTGVAESSLKIYHKDNSGSVSEVTPVNLDLSANTATFTATSFSEFILAGNTNGFITGVDGSAVQPDGTVIPSPISAVPTVTGVAVANSNVDLYLKATGGQADQIDKVAGESNLSLTIDFNSNPPVLPFARTGMQLGGINYMDAAPMFGPDAIGVMWWLPSAQNPILLPSTIGIEDQEILNGVYVYLTTMDIPAGAIGNPDPIVLHWTIYSLRPELFSQIITMMNQQGIPTKVDAFALAFTADQSIPAFVPATLPIDNMGTLQYNSGNGQVEFNPAGAAPILIGSTASNSASSFTARFGFDANNNPISDLEGKTLFDLAPGPDFQIFVQVNGQKSPEVNIAAEKPSAPTDNTAPITTSSIAGTQEAAPYNTYYQNQATVTLTANDPIGEGAAPSGVAKIEYSLSGAMTLGWTTYTAPIVINAAGETIVSYKATDNAGNVENVNTLAIKIDKDSDNDGVYDNFDLCALVAGKAEFDGCPAAISIKGTLHVLYVGNSVGYAGIDDKGRQKNSSKIAMIPGPVGDSRGEVINSVTARVFTYEKVKAQFGNPENDFDKNYDKHYKTSCADIYNTVVPTVERKIKTTPVTQVQLDSSPDLIGVSAKGQYIIAERVIITDPIDSTSRTATVCRKISNADKFNFDYDGNRTPDPVAQVKTTIIKTVKDKCVKNNPSKICVQTDPADEDNFTGSFLAVSYPQNSLWEDDLNTYIYPYVFESDADWTLDVCAQAPTGYQIVGVYDENGVLITSNNCVQTIVAGGTKIAAFEAMDVGSPSVFNMGTTLSLKHAGKTQKVTNQIATKKKARSEMVKDLPKPDKAVTNFLTKKSAKK